MNRIQLSEARAREFFPGFLGKMIHTKTMTLAYWEVEAGAEVPIHHHEHEQIMQVLEGRFEFTVDGETQICEKGDIVAIPSMSPHKGRAITACRLMDVFSPPREDYK